jgi:hypothetical protein
MAVKKVLQQLLPAGYIQKNAPVIDRGIFYDCGYSYFLLMCNHLSTVNFLLIIIEGSLLVSIYSPPGS